MYNPKISIIIPVYNGANYMREAIDSAIAQTYKNVEIIVVNDGSNDNGETDKIARSYGNKIKYIVKENGGSSSALNVGIKNMTGDYFSWLSHDDVYEINRTEEMVKRIKPNIENQVIIGSGKLIDKDSKNILHPKKHLSGDFDSLKLFEMFSMDYNINGCAVLVPKDIIDKIGYFDEGLRYVNDTDYWFRLMIENCFFSCSDDKLVKTRIHSGQVSVTSSELFKKEIKILSKKVLEKLTANPSENLNKISFFVRYSSKNGCLEILLKSVAIMKVSIMKSLYLYFDIFVCFLYGRILVFLKRIYKKIFFKR